MQNYAYFPKPRFRLSLTRYLSDLQLTLAVSKLVPGPLRSQEMRYFSSPAALFMDLVH